MKLSKKLRERILEQFAQSEQEGKPLGLPECRKIDRNLTKVASATFGDLSSILLDEIFQNVEYRKLVSMLRVSREWFAAIAREFAPFIRHIAIRLDALPPSKDTSHLEKNYLMGIPTNTSTLLIFKEPSGDSWSSADNYSETNAQLNELWKTYEEQAARNGRPNRIKTIIYANMALDSNIFVHSAVLRVGLITMVHKVRVLMDIAEIFFMCYPDKADHWTLCEGINHPGKMTINFPTMRGFRLTHRCMPSMEPTYSYPRYGRKILMNTGALILVYFFARPLSEVQMKGLAEVLDHQTFKSQKLDLIRLLMKKYDSECPSILELYVEGMTTDFLSLARPIVQHLLRHFLTKDAPEDYHTTYTLTDTDMFIPLEAPELDQ